MHGDKESIKLTKGNAVICFDIVIPTAKGAIYAMYFKQGEEVANMATDNMTEEAIVPAQKQVRMTIMQAHSQFGHAHEDAVRKAQSS
jgi:hypothetical protein